MQKGDPTTICFVGTAELKTRLEAWAREDDRSVSYIMRDILNREAQRRIQIQAVQNTSTGETAPK